MTSKDLVTSSQPPLDLPKWQTNDWMRYLESLFSIQASELASAMDLRHPELIQALALFQGKGGMPVETVQGMIYGIVLMQFLYTQNYLKFYTPPPILTMGDDLGLM